jgi:hypothetical protein
VQNGAWVIQFDATKSLTFTGVTSITSNDVVITTGETFFTQSLIDLGV